MTPILAGGLVGMAAGLDLFLALGACSLVAALFAFDLPGTLGDLGTWWLTASALCLYSVEAWAERTARVDILWRLAATFLRPAGAAGLAALVLGSTATGSRAIAVLVAAGVALAVHVVRSGWAFLRRLEGDSTALERRLLAEDGAALMLLGTLALPAVLQGVVVAGAVLWIGGHLWPNGRAFLMAASLPWASVRSLWEPPGWQTPAGFPSWIKRKLAPGGVVTGGRLRGTRAAMVGYPGEGAFRRGWVVVRGPSPRFVRRTLRGVDVLTLAPGSARAALPGPGWSSVRVSTEEGRQVLLVTPIDGPGADDLLREL